ncbi:MAG: hypothetical protein AAGJ18_11920, partial [Bacteroidota bacterium]
MWKSIALLVTICFANTIFSQSIGEKLERHQSAYPLEKIYVSHNQPHYASGDTLFGKIFLVNGRTHQYFEGTPIVYVDWMDSEGTVLRSLIVKIAEGTADLSLPILREYGEGEFYLRAYTQYQKNFDESFIFQKAIKVFGEKPLEASKTEREATDFSVQFFPEGGYLVNNLASQVAFKAVDANGEPISVNGVILDQDEKEIATIKSIHEGIGVFRMIPQKATTYKAKVTWNGKGKRVDLPKALKAGTTINANNRKVDKLTLQIATNLEEGLGGFTLIGHIRGQPFINQIFEAEEKSQKLLLDKTKLPSGILHFTVFDPQARPVGERLVYNHNPQENIAIEIDVPQTSYNKKSLVSGEITAKLNNTPVKGDFTFSVYNKTLFPNGTAGINIKNYLLLQSDLKGRIDNINQYFEVNDAKTRTLLDYVMLTHGWRRFNWQDVLEEKPTPIVYPTEESISFAGKVTKDNNRKTPVKADVFLSILDGQNFTSTNLTTEDDGLFYFKGFDLPDSTEVMIQGNIHNPKKKLKAGEAKRVGNRNVRFELLNLHELAFNEKSTLKRTVFAPEKQVSFTEEIAKVRKIDTIYHPEWSIDLSAVTVKAQRIEAKEKRKEATRELFKERGYFYSDFSQKVYTEDITGGGAFYTNIYDLIRDRVVSAQIRTLAPNEKAVFIRGESSISNPTPAIFEVDGVIVSAASAAAIVPTDIALIDVKKGLVATSIYGSQGAGGVISIITKEPQDLNRKVNVKGILNISHLGYHKARTFYAPNYQKRNTDKPDFRTTLYWNPAMRLDEQKGTAPFAFYTGDKLAEFVLFAEGLTEDGQPFVGETIFSVGNN